jgi:ABC-type uncharacterized transport system YnjBCD ATPase subunit
MACCDRWPFALRRERCGFGVEVGRQAHRADRRHALAAAEHARVEDVGNGCQRLRVQRARRLFAQPQNGARVGPFARIG